ncbi:MAG: AAA family ATPase, partial [Chloroflexota bacterium]|nr:AAA family ATPase [Chloroflexota bacterium]
PPAGPAARPDRGASRGAGAVAAGPAAGAAPGAREAREAAQSRAERAEKVLNERRTALTRAEDGLRAARAARSTHDERHSRLTRDSDDLTQRTRDTREAVAAATARERAQQEELNEVTAEAASLRRRGERAAEVLEVAEGEWERARVDEARLAIQSNQHKGELSRADERLGDLGRAETQASSQLARLEKEEAQLGRELSEARALLARGGKSVERLFQRRDRARERLSEDEAALERAKEEVKQVDRRVETARAAERAASDRHHDLNLEERELGGKIVLIRERVEAEWARPFEKLVEMAEPVEGDPAGLKEELAALVQRIERLGPVNMLAIEEHAEQNERLTFLTGQRDDLKRARNDLRAAIREIDQTATRLFLETFQAARENFRRIHQRLFEGGECDLRLGDPDDPLSGPVDIHASPMGKRTRRIDLLSGGERALTALALLFGIYLVKPSPFCVLDEVDAPLDESNIDRFVQLLREFKGQSQFVVITHNPRTIEAADWIYGLTMEEPGVSSVVGVRLEAGAST